MFLRYSTELKNRFLLLFITWTSTGIICYTYKQKILFLFIQPSIFNSTLYSLNFIITNVTEILETYFYLVFFITNQITIILFLYHFLLFIIPGLYSYETNLSKLIFKTNFVVWVISTVTLNKLLFPICWEFFISFYNSLNTQVFKFYFESKLSEYLEFYVSLYYICVLNYQTVILFIVFLKVFKLHYKTIQQIRKFIYFIFVLISTLVTPPDILSQIILSVGLAGAFEFIIFYQQFKLVLIRQPIKTN